MCVATSITCFPFQVIFAFLRLTRLCTPRVIAIIDRVFNLILECIQLIEGLRIRIVGFDGRLPMLRSYFHRFLCPLHTSRLRSYNSLSTFVRQTYIFRCKICAWKDRSLLRIAQRVRVDFCGRLLLLRDVAFSRQGSLVIVMSLHYSWIVVLPK